MPGQGVANILTAIGGITGQFAPTNVAGAAVRQIAQINRDFVDLLF